MVGAQPANIEYLSENSSTKPKIIIIMAIIDITKDILNSFKHKINMPKYKTLKGNITKKLTNTKRKFLPKVSPKLK